MFCVIRASGAVDFTETSYDALCLIHSNYPFNMIISQRSDAEFWESLKDQSFLPADALLMQFTKYAG